MKLSGGTYLIDRGDRREGTVSVFVNYNLTSWTFGLRADPDDCWFDLTIEFGPVNFSFVYWRKAVV